MRIKQTIGGVHYVEEQAGTEKDLHRCGGGQPLLAVDEADKWHGNPPQQNIEGGRVGHEQGDCSVVHVFGLVQIILHLAHGSENRFHCCSHYYPVRNASKAVGLTKETKECRPRSLAED